MYKLGAEFYKELINYIKHRDDENDTHVRNLLILHSIFMENYY